MESLLRNFRKSSSAFWQRCSWHFRTGFFVNFPNLKHCSAWKLRVFEGRRGQQAIVRQSSSCRDHVFPPKNVELYIFKMLFYLPFDEDFFADCHFFRCSVCLSRFIRAELLTPDRTGFYPAPKAVKKGFWGLFADILGGVVENF